MFLALIIAILFLTNHSHGDAGFADRVAQIRTMQHIRRTANSTTDITGNDFKVNYLYKRFVGPSLYLPSSATMEAVPQTVLFYWLLSSLFSMWLRRSVE